MLKQIILATLFAAASLTAARADVTTLTCNQTGPTEYKLNYTFTGSTHSVVISASTHADGSGDLQPILTTKDTNVTVKAGQPGQRIFFFLKTDTGERREVSIRHLPLEGTPNFRDIGGYETTDGRFVKWNMLYRSGVLTYLTPADYTYLAQTGIHVVCDFRTQQENEAAPETWIPNSDVQHLSLPIGTDKKDGQATLQSLVAANPDVEQLRARMIKTYAGFAFTSAPQYAQLFKELETSQHLPLLYHCSAGKDRTGVFSALVLLSLGVPEQTVLQDYALTNQYLIPGSPAVKKMMAATGNSSMMSSLTPDQQKVLMAADPEYLRATINAIRSQYGSFDNYRRTALQVSDQDLTKLKSELLTN